MGGGAVGFSLALSLRRYTSIITHTPNLKTLTADLTLISLGFTASYLGHAIHDYNAGALKIRKEILMGND
jgi:hypothetical protein